MLLRSILSRGTDRVAAANHLQDAVIGFLWEAKNALHAFCAATFRRVSDESFAPLGVIIGNQVLTHEEVQQSEPLREFLQTSTRPESRLFQKLSLGEIVVASIATNEYCLPKAMVQYHNQVGNRSVWYIPFFLRGNVIGCFSLGMPRSEPPSSTEADLLHSIGQQISFSMALHSLAEQESQAELLKERAQLAREIHDTLAQGLLGILLHLETIRRTMDDDRNRAERSIDLARQLAQRNLDDARLAVRLLRDEPSQSADLVFELARMVREATIEGTFPVQFQSEVSRCEVAWNLARQILRIAGEAIQNARRHSRASVIHVRLVQDLQSYRVLIRDNGIGFENNERDRDGKYGLLGMKERAEVAGCKLTITSAHGEGTTVGIEWSQVLNRA
jgi:signal transduction histidine kinase